MYVHTSMGRFPLLLLLTTAAATASLAAWRSATPVLAPNACGDSASLVWEPTTPKQGSLFRVTANGVPALSILHGTVAGQALHFTRDTTDSARVVAFAAAPIDADTTLALVVRCISLTRTDVLAAEVRVATADYPLERLTVAPEFGRPLDSATLARTRREAARALDVAHIAHVTPRLWSEPFILPRDSRITSGFGRGREFNGVVQSRHMGTDFAGAVGAPVRAANRGVARIVDSFFYGGNVVYIDHGAGLNTAYLHLSAHDVAVGDTVERGQVIGRVGATGRVTGPHLHLIVRYGDVTVDPMSLFAIAGDSSQRR